MTDNKLRMDAYYYGFDETGQPDIDLILSAVACAGKSFHHTDQWNDQDSPWPGHSGNSPIEWIGNAALSAAQEMARLKAENEALRSLVLSALEEGNGRPGSGGNAPGHCHEVPGVWDRGNGDRSGTPCGWCRIWNAAQAMAKEASHG